LFGKEGAVVAVIHIHLVEIRDAVSVSQSYPPRIAGPP
jgi:hypothetical protein